MTKTNEFKGMAGGDPSRMPPMVNIEWSCKVCGKAEVIQTRRPRAITIPDHCSALCEDLQHEGNAREIVRTRLNMKLPEAHLLRSGVFRSIVKYGTMLEQVEKNIKSVNRSYAVCPHCKKNAEHFRDVRDKSTKRIAFCSANCAQSAKAKLPSGVVCANTTKKKFDTGVEAEAAVASANAELVSEGEEKMIAYACVCGKWHFGHQSKADAEDLAMSARNALKELLNKAFDDALMNTAA